MTTLPENMVKTNLDTSAKDPKQARSELADNVVKSNVIIAYLTNLFGAAGTKSEARATVGLAYASDEEAIAGEVTDKVVNPANLKAVLSENGAGGSWETIAFSNITTVGTVTMIDWEGIPAEYKVLKVFCAPIDTVGTAGCRFTINVGAGAAAVRSTNYTYLRQRVRTSDADVDMYDYFDSSNFGGDPNAFKDGQAEFLITGLHDVCITTLKGETLTMASDNTYEVNQLYGAHYEEIANSSLHLSNAGGGQYLPSGYYFLLGLKA
ncbi:MAG: hypothetical protein V7727_18490 [Sneathiella sp.]